SRPSATRGGDSLAQARDGGRVRFAAAGAALTRSRWGTRHARGRGDAPQGQRAGLHDVLFVRRPADEGRGPPSSSGARARSLVRASDLRLVAVHSVAGGTVHRAPAPAPL